MSIETELKTIRLAEHALESLRASLSQLAGDGERKVIYQIVRNSIEVVGVQEVDYIAVLEDICGNQYSQLLTTRMAIALDLEEGDRGIVLELRDEESSLGAIARLSHALYGDYDAIEAEEI